MVVLSLLALILVLGYIYCEIRQRQILKYVKNITKAPKLPLLGGIHLFFGKSNADIPKFAEKMLNILKLPCYGWVGPLQLLIILDSPEDLEILLADQNALEKPYIYDFFQNKRGLVTSPPHIWKAHRKILSPSFSINLMKSLIPMFKSKVDVMANKLMKREEGVDIDILVYLYKCSLDMISKSAADIDVDVESKESEEYLDAVVKGAHLVSHRVFAVHLHIEWIYKLSKWYQCQVEVMSKIHSFVLRIISTKKKEINNEIENSASHINDNKLTLEKNEEYFKEKPKIIINQLLNHFNKGQMDMQDVKDEMEVMLYTGSDTSTHLAAYALLMLALNPEVQQKCVDELKRVFVNEDIPVDYDSIKQLTYLEMVIKETLRLFPVIPYIARHINKNIKLRSFTVPAGSVVGIPFTKMNRDPKIWGPDSDKFNPENFLPEKVAQRHPFQYIPFSAGPRNCIGQIYGMFSVRTILAVMLMNFRIGTSLKFEDITLDYDITLRITNKNLVKLYHRKDFWQK